MSRFTLVLEDAAIASLRRCLAAILYDFFLILAIETLVLLIFGLVEGFVLAPGSKLPDVFKLIIMLWVAMYFYVWCWTHGGQTLGMQTWKIKLQSFDGKDVSRRQAWLRVVLACLGFGNIIKIFNARRLSGQDYLSKTVVVTASKKLA